MSTTPLKLWLGLLMMFAGPFFFCCGCMEFQHATETTAEPLNVKLSELESGSVPTNKHLCIGPHVACYFALYYEYYQREGDNAAPGPDQKLASVVYPIVSEQYFTGTFLFDELDELDEPSESGGTNESEETVEPRESDERDDASADADPVTDHDDKSLADLGSGAGLPGIPIKIVRPDVVVTLIESRERRASFLAAVVRELRLEQVRVMNARAEQAATEEPGSFGAVVVRCAGDLRHVMPVAAKLVAPGGVVVAAGPPATRPLPMGTWCEVAGIREGHTRRFAVYRP